MKKLAGSLIQPFLHHFHSNNENFLCFWSSARHKMQVLFALFASWACVYLLFLTSFHNDPDWSNIRRMLRTTLALLPTAHSCRALHNIPVNFIFVSLLYSKSFSPKILSSLSPFWIVHCALDVWCNWYVVQSKKPLVAAWDHWLVC